MIFEELHREYDTKYYENVSLKKGDVFSTTAMTGTVLLKNRFSAIKQTKTIPVSQIRVEGASEIAVGQQANMEAKISPSTASDLEVEWSSSDNTVLTVDKNGIVTAHSEGTATITAVSANGVSGEHTVRVYIPAASVSSSVTELSMCVGEIYALSLTVTPANASHKIQWNTSDPAIVTVNENGELIALADGTAVVTAYVDGLETEVMVNVYEKQLAVTVYQSDIDRMKLQINLQNVSCCNSFNNTVIVSLYDGEKMIAVDTVFIDLNATESTTIFFDMTDYPRTSNYGVSVFVLDECFTPIQAVSEFVTLAW